MLGHGVASIIRYDPGATYRRVGMAALESQLLKLIEERQVDIVVYPLGMEFDFRPAFLRDSLSGVFKVLVLGDDEHYFDVSHRYYAQCFDLVLTTNPLCDRYRLYGIDARFMPVPFDSKTFSPSSDVGKEIDVSFVGAMKSKIGRAEYARALEASGIDFRVYGVGTTAGILSRSQSIEIYRRSRINLNFTGGNLVTPLDATLSINRRIRQVKGRCFMVALCCSFVLSEYAPGIEKVFHIGKEIDVFHDELELIDKIRYYLAHEYEREEMARRSYMRAIKEYDEAAFGRELVSKLEVRVRSRDKQKSTMPLYLDRQFWVRFGAWRFKYLVIFLFSGKPYLFAQEAILLLRTGWFEPHAALWFAAFGLQISARTSSLAALLSSILRGARRALRRS